MKSTLETKNEDGVGLSDAVKTLNDVSCDIWEAAPVPPIRYEDLPSLMSVMVGDVARIVRDARENGHDIDTAEVGKELGNFVLSCTRWAYELGLDPVACVEDAAEAQRAYMKKLLG